jgi:hypothetical protein
VYFKNKNISANLPCRNIAECFRRSCFAMPIKIAGQEPRFPDEYFTSKEEAMPEEIDSHTTYP